MFEYLMPLLVMRSYPRTLLSETYNAVISRQIEYAKAAGHAVGHLRVRVQRAGCRRELSISRLRRARHRVEARSRGRSGRRAVRVSARRAASPEGGRSRTSSISHRRARSGRWATTRRSTTRRSASKRGSAAPIVRTYMAHHHGMSLVALNNCLNDNIMQARFHADPRVQAAELLLQERSPHLVPLDRPPEEHRVEETPGRVVQSHVRRYVTPHTITPRAHLLSNGSLSVMLTNAGGGYTRWRDVAVTRWREDSTCDGWGTFCYVRDLTASRTAASAFWSAGFQPSGRDADSYEATFAPDRADHSPTRRRDRNVHRGRGLARRRRGDSPHLDHESFAQHPRNRADELCRGGARAACGRSGAPGVQQPVHRIVVGPRLRRDHVRAAAARARGSPLHGACAGRPAARGRRRRVRNRSRALHRPRREHPQARRAHAATAPLSGATGAVLDPIVSLRARLRVPPGVTARVSFTTVVAEHEDGVRALIEKYHDPQVCGARVCAGQHA